MGIISKFLGKITKKVPKATLTEQYIRCPQCATLYALFAHVVLESVGEVRCGTCSNTFSALTNRSAPKHRISLPTEFEPHNARLLRIPIAIEPEKAIIETLETSYPDSEVADTAFQTMTESYQVAETAISVQRDPLTSMEILAIAPGDVLANAPIYTRKRKEKTQDSTWNSLLMIFSISLTILLIILLIWLNRDTLGQYSATRSWVETMCQLFNCSLSPYSNPTQIVVQQHQLMPDPADPRRFEVHALIENTSSYSQLLANLEIQINDLDGNPVKKLIFTAEEYAPLEAKTLLEPRQTLYIRLEFIQPTVDLFSYEIKFI